MWVLDVKEKLSKVDTIMEAEHWTKHSINKIPPGVTNLNNKAYSPQSVSFGPYHKGEAHLMQMEDHKYRAFLHLLKRSNKPFEIYVNEEEPTSRPFEKSRDLMHKHSKESTGDIIRSVMEPHEAGIRFKVSKTRSVEDIKFRGGVLSLPLL
ncbi:hypothetical protein GIB67_024014 [Kingdonia uniflora]|uniref:Uncharacterized protein n=1 Tax=Kingdonia uniflora TaxID=39325 RepID=A0A7J7NJM3_9MAGN|nr:hypothetical protein GIB67_024014 [Kingdonia uniflora]